MPRAVHVSVTAEAGRDEGVLDVGEPPENGLQVGKHIHHAGERPVDSRAVERRESSRVRSASWSSRSRGFERAVLSAAGTTDVAVLGAHRRDLRRELMPQAARVESERDVLSVLPERRRPDSEVAEVSQAQVVQHRREPITAGDPDRAVTVLLRAEGGAAEEAGNRAGGIGSGLDGRSANALHRDVEARVARKAPVTRGPQRSRRRLV